MTCEGLEEDGGLRAGAEKHMVGMRTGHFRKEATKKGSGSCTFQPLVRRLWSKGSRNGTGGYYSWIL